MPIPAVFCTCTMYLSDECWTYETEVQVVLPILFIRDLLKRKFEKKRRYYTCLAYVRCESASFCEK